MVKKIISIVAIIVGAFMLLSCVAPTLIGAILEVQMKSQMAGSLGIIGGADGPTAVMVTGVTSVTSVGSAVTEVVVGAVLIVVGIWSLRKSKK